MRLHRQFLALLASVALLAALVPSASAASPWTLYYYVGDNGPFTMPATPAAGTIAQFAFTATPDQALLMSTAGGNLLGTTVNSTFAIAAPAGTTFVGSDTGPTPPTVRFYFRTVNPGLGESAFWWSNPVSIPLATLFADGPGGAALSVALVPANWSDRAGGFGDSNPAHLAAFNTSASNVTQIGLSFGSGSSFAFGDGSNPGGALFNLLQFKVTPAALDHLVLSPSSATIVAGASQAYTAVGFDAYGNGLGDVTSATTFTISGGGSCTGASCTSATAGDHTVTGTDTVGGTIHATATLTVNAAAAAPTPTPSPTATPIESFAGATAVASASASATPVEVVAAATGTPHSATPPPTNSKGPSDGGSSGLLALLISLGFGAVGLFAVGAQRRTMRR
jgi:hypothetical protein